MDINIYHLSFINLAITLLITFSILFYRFVYPKKNVNLILLLLTISIVPVWSIFRSGTYQAGDLHTHTAQLISFYNNLSQGIFIPRWAGELCGKLGCPIFEFYYLLPYYIGSLFHFIGFSILTSIKLVLALSFILSGITMFLWAREEFGKNSGFVAAVFYLFAPFHLIDIHFRGSIGEVLSFVFIPLIFLFGKKIIDSSARYWLILETLTCILLMLSHSSTTIVIIPLASMYVLILWYFKKKKEIYSLFSFFTSTVFALLISTIYWLPALEEVKNSWYGLFTFGSFKPILEYIISPARFGLLFQGNHGEMRLIVGYFHLLVVALGIVFLLKNKFKSKNKYLLIFFVFTFISLFFMMLKISIPIWEKVSILNSFIMVWRLLVPIAFVTSAIAAIVAIRLKNFWLISILVYLTIVLTLLNWGNRKMIPEPQDPVSIESENYTEYFENTPRYIEIVNSAVLIKNSIPYTYSNYKPLEFVSGKGTYKQIKRLEQAHEYVLKIESDSVIKENTLYFPGWKVYVDGEEAKIDYKNLKTDNFNKITFKASKGIHLVEVLYNDTPIRVYARNISILAIIIYLVYIKFYFKYNRRHQKR